MNFALILFILFMLTGIAWLIDKALLAPARRKAGVAQRPIWLEYTAGLFPVIALVFLLRSFLFEPFKIPSGSMVPTLLIGDLILVNKFSYGVRLPIVHTKVLDLGSPQRGDVMVFRFPKDPSVDYIKRVVAVPGDTVSYESNRISINGNPVSMKEAPEFFDAERLTYYRQYLEKLGETEHKILTDLENRISSQVSNPSRSATDATTAAPD